MVTLKCQDVKKRISGEDIKALVSGDPITASLREQEPITFAPGTKIVCSPGGSSGQEAAVMIWVPCRSCKKQRSCPERDGMEGLALFAWAKDASADCAGHVLVEAGPATFSPRPSRLVQQGYRSRTGGLADV